MTSTNWAHTQTWTPSRAARPTSAAEVAVLLREASDNGSTAKAIGTRHSFTGAAATHGVQIVMELLSGVIDVDQATRRVRVRSGTKLADLNQLLHGHGLALANHGNIDQQTLAGAIATGTHGSGARYGVMSTFVKSLQLATPDGSLVECSPEQDPDLFDAARVSLGALGVVTEVTLEAVPAYRIHAVEEPLKLSAMLDGLNGLDGLARDTDYFEMSWYPHTDTVLAKFHTRMAEDDPRDESRPVWRRVVETELVDNVLSEGVGLACSILPRLTPVANKMSTRVRTRKEYTASSYDVFVNPRRVRFTETEYAVPAQAAGDVLRALRAWLDRSPDKVPFPVLLRYAAADDIWLSPCYQRDTAYIAVYQYHRMDNHRYFSAFEDIVSAHEGRPHWGKLHRLGHRTLSRRYPRFADFLAVRDRVDPQRVMANDYLRRVLGD